MIRPASGPTPPTVPLPPWERVLAVVAHPDDESFGLGGILHAFATAGASVHVLCLTQGEASGLRGDIEPAAGPQELARVRQEELRAAATELALDTVTLRDYPDGGLTDVSRATLDDEVAQALAQTAPSGLIVFDPGGVTAHPDHIAATEAARRVARRRDLPVLAWTIPAGVATVLNNEFGAGFIGHEASEIDLRITVDRGAQTRAAAAHVSQAIPTSALWRRLELLGDTEHLRWV